MTLLELRTRTLRALNDSPTAPVFWSPTEINGYLAEALEVVAEEAPAFKRTFTVPRREGTMIYQLPGVGTDILAPFRVWLPDLKRRLDPWTFADLDGRHERWMTVTSTGPWGWFPVSWDQFGIWPPPTTGEGWMQVDAYVWPDALLDDGDSPELHPSSHESLCDYAEGLALLKSWDAQGCVECLQGFLKEYGHVRSMEGVSQLQEKFWSRSSGRESHRQSGTPP